MPVTLPDITTDDATVEIRGVKVPVRGFDFTEVGALLATYPGFAAALTGNVVGILMDKPLMEHALATCVDLAQETKLEQAEKKDLIKEIFRLTWDAIGPFVDLAASLGGSGARLASEIIKATSSESSSPSTSDSNADTAATSS